MGVRFRLLTTWGLFIAWVCWLGWQSVNYTRFPVVSQAQFLNVDLAVVAEMKVLDGAPQPNIHVLRVIWPPMVDNNLEGKDIVLRHWSRVDGFVGPGEYVVPLTKSATGEYELTEMPRSPLAEPSHQKRYVYPAKKFVIEQILRIAPPIRKPAK